MNASAKPVKFLHMVNLPDLTDNGQGGFSNRFNMDAAELEAAGVDFRNRKMRWTATRKVDGVSSMVVAFVMPVNDKTQEALKDCARIEWWWDYQANSEKAGITRETSENAWIRHYGGNDKERAKFLEVATRAFLLPRTVWSNRYVSNNERYYINVSIYAPNGKCLLLPHYMRAPMEDYCIQYYKSLVRKNPSAAWITEVENGKPKVLAFRTEIILGKAEPSDAATFVGKLRKMPSSKGDKKITSWQSIIHHTAMIHFPEHRNKAVQAKLQKKMSENALGGDSDEDLIKELHEEVVDESRNELSQTTYGKYFFLLHWFYEAQWSANTVIERDYHHASNLHQHQLGIVVLDDYTSCVRKQWLLTITGTPSNRRANCVPLPAADAFVTSQPEADETPPFFDRIQWLHKSQETSDGGAGAGINMWSPMRRPTRLMHTVDIVMQAQWANAETQTIKKDVEDLQKKLNLHVSLENGEGFMLVIETEQNSMHRTNVFKFKQFLWLPSFPMAFTTAFGYFDTKSESGVQRNPHTEPDDKHNLFLELIRSVNVHHFYTVKNMQAWPKKKGAAIPDNSGAWLRRSRAGDAYEPLSLTLMPWGVFKNVNGLALTATLGTRDLVSMYASRNEAPPASQFLLWVQYIRSCRVRLMCTPCIGEEDMTPRMKRQYETQPEIKNHHALSDADKMKNMLLQLVGIQLFVESWRARVSVLGIQINLPQTGQADKNKYGQELKNLFLYSGSLVKQLAFNTVRCLTEVPNELKELNRNNDMVPKPVTRLAVRRYQINRMNEKASDLKENGTKSTWYKDYKGKHGLDEYNVNQLHAWQVRARPQKGSCKFDMANQIKNFRNFLKMHEKQLRKENIRFQQKLAYDLHQARFNHVFDTQEALNKMKAVIGQEDTKYGLYSPMKTTSLLAQPFALDFIKSLWHSFKRGGDFDADHYKNQVSLFFEKESVFRQFCDKNVGSIETIQSSIIDMLIAANDFMTGNLKITDLAGIESRFHITSLPMSLLVSKTDSFLDSDIRNYSRDLSTDNYWDDFEAYFAKESDEYYGVSDTCTKTIKKIWEWDKLALMCLALTYEEKANSLINNEDNEDGDDDNDDNDDSNLLDDITLIKTQFESAKDDDHAFLLYTDQDPARNTSHEFSLQEEFKKMIVEKIAFDCGYKWSTAQDQDDASHGNEGQANMAQAGTTNFGESDDSDISYGLNGIRPSDNFEEEIELPDTDFIGKLLDPSAIDLSPMDAVKAVLGARQPVDAGDAADASLSLDEFQAWQDEQRANHEQDTSSDIASVRGDAQVDFQADFMLGFVSRSSNIGARKQQWLQILDFLHSKSQQSATPLAKVVEENLHQHKVLAEAWVALGKQPA